MSTKATGSMMNTPKPQSVLEIEKMSVHYFKMMGIKELDFIDMIRWVTESHLSIRYLNLLTDLGIDCL